MTTQQETEQLPDLGQRVARLEGRFDELSPRIDILQRSVDDLRADMQAGDASLRSEMREGFAALHNEIQAGDASLRSEIQAGDASLRSEMHEGFAALHNEIQAGDASLRTDIQDLRSDINSFKNTMIVVVLGSWVTLMAAFISIFLLQ